MDVAPTAWGYIYEYLHMFHNKTARARPCDDPQKAPFFAVFDKFDQIKIPSSTSLRHAMAIPARHRAQAAYYFKHKCVS